MTVIDFHSHILPIDHGCQSIDDCRAQLELMSAHGTEIAVATPHFYPHVHKIDSFVRKRELAIEELKAEPPSKSPRLCFGAEVLLCEGMEHMSELEHLCINGTRVLLVELPMHALKDGHVDTVEALITNGYTVLLAHIDRYFDVCEEDVKTLLSLGALAQINADALFHRSSAKKIRKYLEFTDRISALGSDMHGTGAKKYSRFVKAQRVLKDDYRTVMHRSKKLLNSAQILELG